MLLLLHQVQCSQHAYAANSCNKTYTGKDYNDMTRNITITALANRRDYTIEDSVQVFDDFIDEVEQSFALIAELGPDVSDRYACFQRKENEDTCLGRRGATRISITDNDGKFLKVVLLLYQLHT